MSFTNILSILKKSNTLDHLKKGSQNKEDIEDFQQVLYFLGFEKELNWATYGADGDYGNSTSKAVKSFAEKNRFQSDGTAISPALADIFIKRIDLLDEIQEIGQDLKDGSIEKLYKKRSKAKTEVAALQTLLNELGYGAELNWDKYQNDGDFGSSTSNALSAYLKSNGINENSDVLSSSTAQKIVDHFSKYYGEAWLKNPKTSDSSAFQTFNGSEFIGKKVYADVEFLPSLERINVHAKNNGVKVHVTSSLRKNANVAGAIVTPAKKSNHMAGHAIDMNLKFPGGWANSGYLKKSNSSNWHVSIAGFINAIREDNGLRWGGDFNKEDTVHIDDHLNKNLDNWEQRFKAVQEAWLNS